MVGLTASEIAGYGVGALLVCVTVYAPKVDVLLSASQRSSLGMCKRCGDLRMIACSRCRGTGYVKSNGPFSFRLMDDVYEWLSDSESKTNSIRCSKCQARGHFSCPSCSDIPQA
ncbi:hypothetical protein ACOSP7_028213 [Xanthoceras sorbifolium]|uniref:Uncharacterized protein n=1 Tax=Xanthoceras sorbifolium TaxID=99658 RepID=A0ABQ8HD84_9ROSI|nr:hypothetical protein JRO89_XS12G0211700 [Xanthoceras sorbifolium]